MAKWLVQKNRSTGRYIVQWRDGRSVRGYASHDLAKALHDAYEGWLSWRFNLLRGINPEITPVVHPMRTTQRELRNNHNATRQRIAD